MNMNHRNIFSLVWLQKQSLQKKKKPKQTALHLYNKKNVIKENQSYNLSFIKVMDEKLGERFFIFAITLQENRTYRMGKRIKFMALNWKIITNNKKCRCRQWMTMILL